MLSAGGEVWQRDTQLAGLGERLVMTVALPYLWGLPPAFDTLRCLRPVHAAATSSASHQLRQKINVPVYLMSQRRRYIECRDAILQGGGIVHKVSKQWQLM